MEKKYFLIKFSYEHYCQGYEWVTEYLLVYAKNFDDAVEKIKNSSNVHKYLNPKDFENCTIE